MNQVFRQFQYPTSPGTVVLPRFAVGVLMARKITAIENPHDAIFASRRGTWLSPPNVRRQWRQARADTGLEWVSPHTFRKTVATLIDKEADADHAAAQLGHGSKEITKKHYIVKPALVLQRWIVVLGLLSSVVALAGLGLAAPSVV